MSEKTKIDNISLNLEDTIIVFVRSDEIVADINSKGCELLESSKEEVLDKNWFEVFIPKNVREETRISFHQLLDGSSRRGHVEKQVLTKSGKERMISWLNIPVKDEKGKFIGAIFSGQDITDRKLFEEKYIRLASFPAFDPNPIVEVDFDGKITYTNPAAKKVFPNLEKKGLDQPFFSDWEAVSCVFKDKIAVEYSFGREINLDGALVPTAILIHANRT